MLQINSNSVIGKFITKVLGSWFYREESQEPGYESISEHLFDMHPGITYHRNADQNETPQLAHVRK